MNTPAHALINLWILKRDGSHRRSFSIVLGALVPDSMMFVFYFWHRLIGTTESQIWSVEYYDQVWQAIIDLFNSIPLIAIGLLICWKAQRPLLFAFFASMLLHTIGDLPLHHDDAHRHFIPFTDWRFISPVSYWDPSHLGDWVSRLEFISVLVGSVFLYLKHPSTRYWVAGLGAVYLAYWAYVVLVWM